jgi:cold-inducible RNA-binding protein
MTNKIYVGNLPYSVTDASLNSNFSEFGSVTSAKVMMDRDTGRSKGFAFVEMGNGQEAQAAIDGLNGQSVDGRSIVVNLARPREERPAGNFGYRG